MYCLTRNLSVQMAGILLQTEIDSCQTKVSVPLNWGFQVLTTICLLSIINKNESLETKELRKELLHFTTQCRQSLLCFPSDAKERWVCRQGNAEVRGSECWKLANELTGLRVPDSNERACVRPTCEQSTIGWLLRMELSSVMIPQITFGGGRLRHDGLK